YNYSWYLNDTLIENSTDFKIDIDGFGTYRVEITDEYGCKVTPAAVEVLTSVKSIVDNQSIKIYPTETDGIINISFNDPTFYSYKIELYNLIGVKILEIPASSKSLHKLDLTNYSKGAYIIKIVEGTDSYFQKIILK
ncbi:MAG: T9SS type A sorting domain-containing protein, partial [Candidatus Kapaibacterium sp.]